MLGNRYSQHSFAQIPNVNIGRSKFDRSFAAKDTFNFDYLVPIYIDEVLPGDTFNLNMNVFARLATQLVPIMDNIYIDYFFFFIPNRLIWSNWEKFNGAQDNPGDSTSYTMPYMDSPTSSPAGFPVGSIYDKYGLPTDIATLRINNTLPLRCYNIVWNRWFRDENLQNSVIENTDNGPDAYSDYVLLKRGKRHDYFTSALPWPQKGTAVDLPLGTSAPVLRKSNAPAWVGYQAGTNTVVDQTGSFDLHHAAFSASDSGKLYWASESVANQATTHGTPIGASLDPGTNGLYADLSTATAATINSLRQAFQIQSLLELDARGGTRYVEILKAHFGVTSPDFRLQRPEYLGGGETRINVHVVAQTAATATGSPQGNLASFATAQAGGRKIGFTKSFVEHGFVLGLACARADITYQQGLNRMWNRSTRYDHFWPKLQQIGEQSILNKELYCKADANDDLVFGYQERYAEYRYMPSQIKGEFRSTFSTPLDFWHMAEEFGSLPALNSTFIVQNTPIGRAISVQADQYGSSDLIHDVWFDLKCARPMLTYSVPASLGRF